MKLYIFGKCIALNVNGKKLIWGKKCKSLPNCFAFTLRYWLCQMNRMTLCWIIIVFCSLKYGKREVLGHKRKIINYLSISRLGLCNSANAIPPKKSFRASKIFPVKVKHLFLFCFSLNLFFPLFISNAMRTFHFVSGLFCDCH